MNRILSRLVKRGLLFGITLVFSLTPLAGSPGDLADAKAQNIQYLPEARDFATLVLRDPWDMNEFYDVSQEINADGQFNLVQNIRVEDSVFYAQSTSLRDAHFFVLFPGIYDTIAVGKTGVRYPISSKEYHCMYFAMKVDSKAADSWGPDQIQVFWFADGAMNNGSGPWGSTPGNQIYPEAYGNAPKTYWKLYSLDLAKAESTTSWNWNDQSVWRGLRIDPTLQADVNFAVDWVRLTNCSASTANITWTPKSGSYSLWVRPEGTTRNIRVVTDVNGSSGSYALDTQGLAPGTYQVGLGSNTDCCSLWSQSTVVINQTPIVRFARPSFTSGAAYYTHPGMPWEFNDSSDVTKILNTNGTFQNGVLDLVTDSGPLPAGNDAQVFLYTPQSFNGSQYRYLTFRYYTEAPWQRFGGGMVIRWIWTIPGASGLSGRQCHLVSQDIPHEVGWQTFTVDLFDPYNGSVEQTNGDCPGGPLSWASSMNISQLRFDPNENIMGYPLHQQLDWIRLNKVDSIRQGQPFPIQASLSKPPKDMKNISFYYTNNLQQPTQHPVVYFSEPRFSEVPLATQIDELGALQSSANYRVFLPLGMRNYANLSFTPITNGVYIGWDTSAVAPGEYHICTVVEDKYNQATYCSEAAMTVVAP
jgi:hypothetical protein